MKLKFFIVIVATTMVLVSCASAPLEPTLSYTWDETEKNSYAYLKKIDEESFNNLLETYKKCIEVSDLNGKPTMVTIKGVEVEERGGTPPGVCADYGYLLIKSGKVEEGKEMLRKEIELYPESAKFVKRILELVR